MIHVEEENNNLNRNKKSKVNKVNNKIFNFNKNIKFLFFFKEKTPAYLIHLDS